MENEEIDLIEVMAKLWHRKRTIMYIALFFLVGGLVLAFFLPRKYTAQCTLGLEMEDRTTRISVEGMSPFQSMPMGDMRNTRIPHISHRHTLKRRHSFDTDSRSPVFHFQTQGTFSERVDLFSFIYR